MARITELNAQTERNPRFRTYTTSVNTKSRSELVDLVELVKIRQRSCTACIAFFDPDLCEMPSGVATAI